MKRKIVFIIIVLVFARESAAQRTEITLTLNEQFFDAMLDAVFQNSSPIEFPLLSQTPSPASQASRVPMASAFGSRYKGACPETVRVLRELKGTRTSVRFRDGKIYAPLAFSGSYNPPFIGCVEFSGLAESMIDLEFDAGSQRLLARATVQNVSLNGTSGVGGTLIARMIQGSIDKKVNPIEVAKLDKFTFVIPLRNANQLRVRATGIRHEIVSGSLNVHIAVEFLKD